MSDKTVRVRLTAMVSEYMAGMTKATASTAAFGKTAQGVGITASGSLIKTGAAAIGLGTAIVYGVGQAVQAAVGWEQAFTRIAALSNASAADVERWKGEVLALAGETARAPQELADALYYLASAGLAADDIMPALKASAQGAAVGLGETADVAKTVAFALNAYADSGLTAAHVTDVLVAAIREGSAEPGDFAGEVGRLFPIASKLGVTVDEVVASLSALSNMGLPVHEGVTAMRGALQAIAAPGPQAAQAMADVGISAQELLDTIKRDGLYAALVLLDKAARDNTDTEAEYAGVLRKVIPNIRALTGEMALTGQNAESAKQVFDAVTHSTGDMAEAFGLTAQGPAFTFQQLMADLQVLLIDLGEAFLPLAVNMAEAFSDILHPVSELLQFIAQVPGAIDLVTLALMALVATKAVDFFVGMTTAAKAAAAANVELAAAEELAATAAKDQAISQWGAQLAELNMTARAASGGVMTLASESAGLGGVVARLGNRLGGIAAAAALIKGAMIGMEEFKHIFTDHDFEAAVRDVADGMRLFGYAIPDLGPTTNQLDSFKDSWGSIRRGLEAGTVSADEAKAAISELADELGINLTDAFYANIDAVARKAQIDKAWLVGTDAINAAIATTRERAIRSGDGMSFATEKFKEFAEAMGQDGTEMLAKWSDAVAKRTTDNGKAMREFLLDVQGQWADFQQHVKESIDFAPDLISELESAASSARDTLAGDISGMSAADLAKTRADANLTATEVLHAFQTAKKQTQDFTHDLLVISRTGGDAGKALAASFLEAGDVITAQVVADAPDKMREQIVRSFGAQQDAADRLATKLTQSIVAPLDKILELLQFIAQKWGFEVDGNTSDADAKLSRLQQKLLNLTQHKYMVTVHFGAGGDIVPPRGPETDHAGGMVGSGAKRYHSGSPMIRSNEVPAILERGERVLTRAQNREYEAIMRGSMVAASAMGSGERMTFDPRIQIVEADIRIANWERGTGHFRAIARAEVNENGAYDERLARMSR